MSEYEKFILDAAGYIQFVVEKGGTMSEVGATLAHDIMGLARKDTCFSPRSSGYAKHFHG